MQINESDLSCSVGTNLFNENGGCTDSNGDELVVKDALGGDPSVVVKVDGKIEEV